jgi:hypothetical protein
MPIDLAAVDWPYVAVLAALVFVSALVGNLLAFRHRVKAIMTTIVFVGMFLFWAYYPHGLPLPTSLKVQKVDVGPTVPVAPAPDLTSPASPPSR